jgi:tetratricopeptide (TPR) repeat protein
MERRDKYVRAATSYLRGARDRLRVYDFSSPPPRERIDVPMGTAYWSLLDAAIETATEIVEELPDDFFESYEVQDYFGLAETFGPLGKTSQADEPFEKAQKLLAAFEGRLKRGELLRRIQALETTNGRTDEEAEMYRAKAQELREGLDV